MKEQDAFKMDISLGKTKEQYVFKGKKYRISILSDVLIRLEYNEDGVFNDYPTIFAINRRFKKDPNIVVKQDDKYLNITNDYFILEYSKEKPYEASKLVPDTNLRISLKNTTDKLWYFNHPEIRNYKGSVHSFDTEKDITLSNGLYSTDGFASFNDTATPVFVSDGTVRKNPSDGIDMYVFVYNDDFSKALESYYELTGHPGLIPRYALGIWWNKNERYNEEDIIKLVENFKKSEIPVSNLVLGDTWHTEEKEKEIYPNFEFSSSKFKNPKDLIDTLHKNNIYFGLSINTMNNLTPKDKFYEKAKKILKESNETFPFNVYNSEFLKSFFNDVIDPLINIGVDSIFLTDNQKDYVALFILSHFAFKNFDKFNNTRGLILARNSGFATHRYPTLYSGETYVSWNTLKYLPFYNITSSNIGLTWWSHDIGGFKGGIEDRELYIRYVELGVYSPIFRFSSDKGHFYKREPWKWDVKTQKIVKDYTHVRHRLIPYIYTFAYDYSKNGTQLLKPIYYSYKEIYDEPLYRNEYYFGSELFVCPITVPKDTVMNRVVHKIFIPDGVWYDFKTGKKFPGAKRYVTFYKDEDYPVYAKSGAIIPMAILDNENLNDTKAPKKMEIQVFPGNDGSFNLYEDDGISDNYKKGEYVITNIEYTYKQNDYSLTIRPVEGVKGIIPETRSYKIRFRNTKEAETVSVKAGVINKLFKVRSDGADFIIEVDDVSTSEVLTITCGGKDIEIDAVRLINEDIDEIISDLQIETSLKEIIANIIFNTDMPIRKKRIEIRKLKTKGLNSIFIKMFLKLLEYISEI